MASRALLLLQRLQLSHLRKQVDGGIQSLSDIVTIVPFTSSMGMCTGH